MSYTQIDQLQQAVSAIAALQSKKPKTPRVGSPDFSSIVSQIRQALLHNVGADVQRYKRLHDALAGSGVPLAALSVCGRGTREIRYTQLMRYFLSPQEPHGLGSRLLVAFLAPELEATGLSPHQVPWEDAEVHAEFGLGAIEVGSKNVSSTLDVFVKAGDLVVLIEHKLNSPESGSTQRGELTQLRRYSRAFEQNYADLSRGNVLKIYLTPGARQPKEDSDWIALDHSTFISRISRVLGDSSLTAIARHNLSAFIWDLICGPLAFAGRDRTDLISKLTDAIDKPARSIALKGWCNRNLPNFETMLRTVEVCNG